MEKKAETKEPVKKKRKYTRRKKIVAVARNGSALKDLLILAESYGTAEGRKNKARFKELIQRAQELA